MHFDQDMLDSIREMREAEEHRRRKEIEGFREQLSNDELVVALPWGKSLQEPTLKALALAGIDVERLHSRLLVPKISGLAGVNRGAFFKPVDIPRYVSGPGIGIGITGMDTIREFGTKYRYLINAEVCATLPFSRATRGPTRCVLFARESDDIKTFKDMRKLFGRSYGGCTVASEYPEETGVFLSKHRLKGRVVKVRGSVETLVALRRFRFGVALTETGMTLKVNGLRRIATLFESPTVLIANKTFLQIPEARELVSDLVARLKCAVAEPNA